MFVQRSEFNSGWRIALYKNYLLLLSYLFLRMNQRVRKRCQSAESVVCFFPVKDPQTKGLWLFRQRHWLTGDRQLLNHNTDPLTAGLANDLEDESCLWEEAADRDICCAESPIRPAEYWKVTAVLSRIRLTGSWRLVYQMTQLTGSWRLVHQMTQLTGSWRPFYEKPSWSEMIQLTGSCLSVCLSCCFTST